jgi:hypothetical protein
MDFTIDDLLVLVPAAAAEMRREFVRKSDEYIKTDGMRSQRAACFMLALRALSLLRGMGKLLQAETFDSYDVLTRAFLESRDLLTTFRFDEEATREHVQVWFKNKDKSAWQAKHRVVEEFLKTVGANNLQLAPRWGRFSALSHPTFGASRNSAALINFSMPPEKARSLAIIWQDKKADYIHSTMSLFIAMCIDSPGWVPLGCEQKRMLRAESLRVIARDFFSPRPPRQV